MDDYDDAEIESAIDPADAEVGEDHHDDRSSSLSDPEDENDISGEQSAIEDGSRDGAHKSLEIDSEAETERLDQTPHKLQKHPDNLGRTPSKLSQTATADEELSEPASPVPIDAGAASSTSTIATTGQKRKRSETVDSSLTSAESDLGQSPRKRKHEEEEANATETIEDAEPVDQNVSRGEETPILDEPRRGPIKGPKGRKGKKGKKHKEPVEDTVPVPAEDLAEALEEAAATTEEDPVKTEEQRKLKKEASSDYDELTKVFRSFKEKVYNERLATLNAELQLLSQTETVHPEYLRQVACVDARLQKQMKEARAYYNYRLRCIRERTLGDRSQLHSQYFQRVRQVREDMLSKLGEDWYAIQRERRQSQLDGYDTVLFKFPPNRGVRLRQQAKYNQEVSVLSGVAKYVGFPAAPEIAGVEGAAVEEDFGKMKISRSVQQTTTAPNRPVWLPAPPTATFTQNERLAHDQYLEQNAWARPQASVHAHPAPGISHTPDWAEHRAASGSGQSKFVRNLVGAGEGPAPQNSSPFATPTLQQKQPLLFDQNEVASAERPPPITYPKPRENGNQTVPGFRDISGVSTIEDAQLEASEGANQIFGTSQIHRHPVEDRREVVANSGFVRPPEGAFGTPAPLTSLRAGGEGGGGGV